MTEPAILTRIDIIAVEREARRQRAEAFRAAFAAAWRWLRGLSAPVGRPVTR